jgi:hypothetical protein
MKYFAEIVEQRDDEKSPKTFKVEVFSLTQAKNKIKTAKKDFVGLKYSKRFHICRHIEAGEKENQPCSIQKL